MSAAMILQFVMAALQAMPSAIQAGSTIETQIANLTAQLNLFKTENRDPTAAEWAALNGQLLAQLAALQAKANPAQ